MLGRMSFAVVNPWSSQNEQASEDMSYLSKANLQITVGVGMPACSGHPFTKLISHIMFLHVKHIIYFLRK